MTERWYEDFEVGASILTPAHTFCEAEITQFAGKFDPQPFHLDAQAAKASFYGGLIASGWHVGALVFSLFMQTKPFAVNASLGSPGVEQLRWWLPVRPGDVIQAEVTVRTKRITRSNPDRGLIMLDWDVTNQHRERVMTFASAQLVALRPL
ncbi:MAG: MaoC family dehydratase [Gammaproteobacteria bacterium]|nr:MaoC family dehydratase [Gammaproteobacteria bacterium]